MLLEKVDQEMIQSIIIILEGRLETCKEWLKKDEKVYGKGSLEHAKTFNEIESIKFKLKQLN